MLLKSFVHLRCYTKYTLHLLDYSCMCANIVLLDTQARSIVPFEDTSKFRVERKKKKTKSTFSLAVVSVVLAGKMI